ncbi:MAG: serine hydrolase [Flavobacteriales bacterium]|nr:serine hydrolase [Flavobacteriales bacterium]
MQPEAPFLIASNIKTYVSATILRLVEEHQLNLNDPVGPLITEKSRALFTSDGYDLQAITLRHLLSHTSGLDSYTGCGYIDSIAAHPIHRYFA